MTAPVEPTPATPVPAPTPQPAAPAPAPQPAAPAAFDPKNLPADAQAWLAKQIADADAKARVGSKTNARNELVQELAKALGIGHDEPLDPAKLTEQLRRSQEDAQDYEEAAIAARMELDVWRAAGRLGANAERLLDSRAFVDEVNELEFTDEADFNTKTEETIKKWLEKDPTLRAGGQAPQRMGADHTGGPSGGQGQRPTSITAAVASAYRPR